MATEQQNFGSFYEAIGNPRHVVAPMVDQSDLAFRMMTRKYGAELVYTQMFNANSFVNSREFREINFTTCKEDRPLIVQIAGHDPDVMLKAAKYVENDCDAIDINLGCPQGIAKRGRYGAFLMEELDLLERIVKTLSSNVKVPITCKTRIFKDYNKTIQLLETLVNAGASLLTIHGRTKEEKGQLIQAVDWEMIRRIKEHFKGRVPIIANGGIETYNDVLECFQLTGVDGVMSSEGILENPTIFSNNCYSLSQMDMADEYLSFCGIYPTRHMKTIRLHLIKFLHRYIDQHTVLRDALGKAHSMEEFRDAINLCRELVQDESLYAETWYRRYRNAAGKVLTGTNIQTINMKNSFIFANNHKNDDEIWCGYNNEDGNNEDNPDDVPVFTLSTSVGSSGLPVVLADSEFYKQPTTPSILQLLISSHTAYTLHRASMIMISTIIAYDLPPARMSITGVHDSNHTKINSL
eukprot:gene7479-10193_t